MAKALSHQPLDQSAATLRQLKLVVILLVVSNIGLGVFSFYLLRTLDRRYSSLIGDTVPILADLRELTADVADAHRANGRIFLNAPKEKRLALAQRARETLADQ